MDRSSLKIFVRAKGSVEESSCSLSKDLHELTVLDPAGKDPPQTFEYFQIFVDASQEEVFEISSRPIIEHVLDGFDGLIMAYGPSNSGKTFTLFGRDPHPGIYSQSVSALFEEAHKISTQKDIGIIVSMVEVFGNQIRDLGLSYKDPHALSVFPSQQLDLSELNGRVYVHQITEVLVRTPEEALAILQQVNDMRASLEAKQGKYVDKAHTIVSIRLRQKYKASSWDQYSESVLFIVELPGSEKPKLRKGQDFYDSLNASSSFHAISKCLSELNSISCTFSDHKITKILENAFKNNSMISLIGTIDISKEQNEETLRTLGFIDKCKATSFNVQFGESSNADLTIKLLQDERAALKEKLKKMEGNQEEQLRKIVQLIGVEHDIDIFLQAQPGSKELQKLAAQREAVLKVDSLTKRNREIEKRVEENKKIFEKIKKIEFQTQEKHLRQVLEIKDELNRLRDSLEEVKATHEFNTKTQVETKTMELNEMLTNSHRLVSEKEEIMRKIPNSIKTSIVLPNIEEVKEFGKTEVVNEFTFKSIEQQKNHNEHFQSTKKQLEMHLSQRESSLQILNNTFEEAKSKKMKQIERLKEEMKNLFETINSQKKVINGIYNGEFNQNITDVLFPDEIIPEFPTQAMYPHLFSMISSKKSVHPIKKMKEVQKELKKSSASLDPSVFTDIIELGERDSKYLIEGLRNTFLMSQKEVEQAEEAKAIVDKVYQRLENEIKNAEEEKERFKELYLQEIRKQNDVKSYIFHQKIKKRMSHNPKNNLF